MANVRWKDKTSIATSADTGDTMPITDASDTETDKHIHPQQIKAFVLGAQASSTVRTITDATAITKFDMNGLELILDADADTSITADTDDTIDIRIAGADDFQFTANVFNALSGSSIQEAGVDISPVGKQTIWVPAGAMQTRVTTAAAASNAIEVATSLIALRTMDFAGDADDFAGFTVQMPQSWDAGSMTASYVWSTDTGRQAGSDAGVAWSIRAYGASDTDTGQGPDQLTDTGPYGSLVITHDNVNDTGGSANEMHITIDSPSFQAGDTGEKAGDWIYFEVGRDVSDTGDTLTSKNARLHGVKIHYTTSASTDTGT